MYCFVCIFLTTHGTFFCSGIPKPLGLVWAHVLHIRVFSFWSHLCFFLSGAWLEGYKSFLVFVVVCGHFRVRHAFVGVVCVGGLICKGELIFYFMRNLPLMVEY